MLYIYIYIYIYMYYIYNVHIHCLKSVYIRSYSGPYFPAFGLNTERYGVSFRIQSKCGEIRTKIVVLYGDFWRKRGRAFPNFEPLKNS